MFKVGDAVVFRASAWFAHDHGPNVPSNGSVGWVIEVDTPEYDEIPYYVRFACGAHNGGGNEWWVDEESLEKLDDPEV